MSRRRVLVQAGHVAPREPGFEAGTGAVMEQELTRQMAGALAALLRADGRFDVTVAPGDLPDGWAGDVVVYQHGDGSANPAARGYSFGWNVNAPGLAPQLARLIGAGYEAIGHPGGHHADNYTGGLRGYYGYRRTNAPTELLVENGFLSNPAERAWMFANIGRMARVQYDAIVRHLGLAPAVTGGKRPTWADGLQVWVTPADGVTRKFIGWSQAWPAVEWIARNGLRPGTRAAIAWGEGERRRVVRDPQVVVNVCRALVYRYRKGMLR